MIRCNIPSTRHEILELILRQKPLLLVMAVASASLCSAQEWIPACILVLPMPTMIHGSTL
jgi:hypothetical protein